MKPNKIIMVSGFSKPTAPDSFSVSTSTVYRDPDNNCYDFLGNIIEDPWDVVDTFIRSDFMRGYAPFVSATMLFDSWQFTGTANHFQLLELDSIGILLEGVETSILSTERTGT